MNRSFLKVAIATMASVAMLAVAPSAMSETASGMGDLIGIRGSSIENTMQARGFEYARNLGAATLYWNASEKRCISILVDNGRVASVEAATVEQCGKQGGGSGAAVAVGAVALVGLAALLASRHKDKNSSSDAAYSRSYDHGYDDGLNGRRFQRGQPDAYHQGYLAGERYRGAPHRDHSATYVEGAPRRAQDACKRRADTFFGAVPGVSRPVSGYEYGRGNYEIVTSTHKVEANCSVSARGYVTDFRRRN